jgi:hypothetical protein
MSIFSRTLWSEPAAAARWPEGSGLRGTSTCTMVGTTFSWCLTIADARSCSDGQAITTFTAGFTTSGDSLHRCCAKASIIPLCKDARRTASTSEDAEPSLDTTALSYDWRSSKH